MIKKQKINPGDVFKIDLKNGKYVFGRVLKNPLYAFYDLQAETIPSLDYILSRPVLFKVWVMKYAITKNVWEVIGHRPLEIDLETSPRFFKQDGISKKLSIYHESKETPASIHECEGLECAAVWDPNHIEDRLRDHFAGRKNKWVESLKIKMPPTANP
jgi:hypothetical protein